jgi:hypothetical protein
LEVSVTLNVPYPLRAVPLLLASAWWLVGASARAAENVPGTGSPDFLLTGASVKLMPDLDLLVFEATVRGKAGGTRPAARGQLDGAPVLGYVFPTSLKSEDIGFAPTEGIVALAVTAHPDFDDSPLWDENLDRKYDNDGAVFHTHWVVLVKDDRVSGGLSVKEYRKADARVVVPPTAPPMPMYMDSPGHSVVLRGDKVRVLVPAARVYGRTSFSYDAVTAYMEVSTSDQKPMLGVHKVFSVLSGNLSLPYSVQKP